MENRITRERVEVGDWGWHHWREKKKWFQKNISSAKSNTGQGSGTLAEGALGSYLGVFLDFLTTCVTPEVSKVLKFFIRREREQWGS